MKKKTALALALSAASSISLAGSLSPAAVWGFNQTLNAEGGGPSLQAINPLGGNGFVRDTVFGEQRWVYRYDGSLSPSQQAGLFVDTRSLLNADKQYSVDLVFKFDRNPNGWANILSVGNRSSDNGLYLNQYDRLQIHPLGAGNTVFDIDAYHRVTMSHDGNQVAVYLDGIKQFQWATNKLDFDAYTGANPQRLLHFFADNVLGGGGGEFMDGTVAAIQLFDSALSEADVRGLAGLPPQVSAAVPEPASLALSLAGLLAAAGLRRRAQRAAR